MDSPDTGSILRQMFRMSYLVIRDVVCLLITTLHICRIYCFLNQNTIVRKRFKKLHSLDKLFRHFSTVYYDSICRAMYILKQTSYYGSLKSIKQSVYVCGMKIITVIALSVTSEFVFENVICMNVFQVGICFIMF